MFNYRDLLGRTYIDGLQDCYSVLREYFAKAYDLKLPNYARPTRFWEQLDLYGMYGKHGFRPVVDGSWALGDVLLMPIRTPVNSHALAIVDDNTVLHHMPGQLSRVDDLHPKWSNRATVVLRHPQITARNSEKVEVKMVQEVLDAAVLRNPRVQALIAEQMARRS